MIRTWKEFSELKSGDKITVDELWNIFDDDVSICVKDDSVRGCKHISRKEVKLGDWINNGTRFIQLISLTTIM